MVDLPEPNSGVKYRVALLVDIYDDEADDPVTAAKEAFANIETSLLNGSLPILEVTTLGTGAVMDVDLEYWSREEDDDE